MYIYIYMYRYIYIYVYLYICSFRYLWIITGRRDARGTPRMVGLVDRLRALLCARHSRSLAAQLAALDSRYCAPSVGCSAPLVFLPTSALGPARHGCLCACSPRMRRPCGGGRMRSRTVGFRGRRDGRESHYVRGLLAADCAEESLADRQLGFTTLHDRRIRASHLGVAYDTERDQHHEHRGAAPAANQRRLRSSDRQTMPACSEGQMQ